MSRLWKFLNAVSANLSGVTRLDSTASFTGMAVHGASRGIGNGSPMDLTPENPYAHSDSCDCMDCIHLK